MEDDLLQIRKSDLENHNKDGGSWVVIHGKVYDLHLFRQYAPCGSDYLLQYIGEGQWLMQSGAYLRNASLKDSTFKNVLRIQRGYILVE